MNTVLITADALRADHLGQYGYQRNTMPVLDRLLDEGTLFETAYTNGAHIQLSIPSILTGQYNGVSQLQSGHTIPSVLSDSDVTTAGIHSNSVIRNDFGRIPGFFFISRSTKANGHNR
jgi:glucan phosphoethanolaminetransferase (alkaline phosphatase superfamily)